MESLCVKKAPSDEVDSMVEAAFTACAESKCRYFEALANERLARLYFDEEPEETKGAKYLNRAIDLYRSWGALAKVEWLENKERYRYSLNFKVRSRVGTMVRLVITLTVQTVLSSWITNEGSTDNPH